MFPSTRQWGVILFGALVVGLLIGTRLDATWAGGQGYRPPLIARAIGGTGGSVDFPRGSIIETKANEIAMLEINGTIVAIHENTRLELAILTDERIELVVTKGRVAVSGKATEKRKITVRTNEVIATTIGGEFSLVNYDFQQRVTIIPFSGSVGVVIHDESGLIIYQPTDISEVAPYQITETTFTVAGSVAEEFYRWFLDATTLSE